MNLIFLGQFIPSLVPITEVRLNVSISQKVKSTDGFRDLYKQMLMEQLISVSG